MRRPSERFRDRGDPRNPSEPGAAPSPIRGAPWPTGSERLPIDPSGGLDEHDVPEPPPAEVGGTLGLLPLLGIVLVVAGVFAYVGMTFMARWSGVATKTHSAETSIAEAQSPAMIQPRAAAPQVMPPSPVPTSSSIAITTAAAAAQIPDPVSRVDNGEQSSNVRTANAAPPARAVQGVTDTEIR